MWGTNAFYINALAFICHMLCLYHFLKGSFLATGAQKPDSCYCLKGWKLWPTSSSWVLVLASAQILYTSLFSRDTAPDFCHTEGIITMGEPDSCIFRPEVTWKWSCGFRKTGWEIILILELCWGECITCSPSYYLEHTVLEEQSSILSICIYLKLAVVNLPLGHCFYGKNAIWVLEQSFWKSIDQGILLNADFDLIGLERDLRICNINKLLCH